MPSLRSINAEAGTSFRRWKELTEAVTIEEAKPTPIPEVHGPGPSPEGARGDEGVAGSTRLEDHPDIAKALAEGWTLKDCENGRNAARRMYGKIAAAQHHHGKDSPEAQAAIDEANRVSVMLTTARAAYNRITYPERYV